MTSLNEFCFNHRMRVRWPEVDAQKVVFNGHYLTYLDTAISEYWRTVGLPYPEGLAHLHGDVFVRSNALQYHAPARLDDWLDIGLRCERIGRSSITMVWTIRANGRQLVSGETVYVFTTLGVARSTPVPDALRLQIACHAQGKPVHALQCGTWSVMEQGARAVRTAVFIEEQSIDEAEEWDDEDAGACHAVVSNLAGLALATGRLITQGLGLAPGQAKIGRMAVLRSSRGVGLGQQVLQALMAQARTQGVSDLSLHAQTSAQAFYQRVGFLPEGPVFDEVGIPHIVMSLKL